MKALIEGDWDKTDIGNPERELPLALIAQDHGLSETASVQEVSIHIAGLITIATIERFSQELQAVPGTTEAWAALSEKLGAENLALATTSRADRMDASLNHAINPLTGENAKLGETFPEGTRRFSGYGGPNKYDAFFAQSGWDPSECVIVEDSDSGAAYTKADRPETKVIGTVAANFFTDKPAQAAKLMGKGADIFISTMHDLPKAVEWLNAHLDPAQKPDFSGKVFLPKTDEVKVAPPVPNGP